MFFVGVPGEVQLEETHFGEANFLEEFFQVSQGILGELRPKGQTLSLREIPGIIHQFVGDLWNLFFKYIRMDGEGVDDQVLSINLSFLTIAVPSAEN